jgi:hypothetical protein
LAARLKPVEREIQDDLYLIVFSVHIEAMRRQHDDTEACENRSASLARKHLQRSRGGISRYQRFARLYAEDVGWYAPVFKPQSASHFKARSGAASAF